MPELIAQGPLPDDRWRRRLPDEGVVCIIGRTAEPLAVRWDDRISRQHAKICWTGGRLEVEKLDGARNAIFYRGRQREKFSAATGEHFVIGQTTFTVLDQQLQPDPTSDPPAFAEQTFSAHILRQQKYKDADRRIESLSKLPQLISSAGSDQELWRIVSLLLEGVPDATFVAIVQLSDDSSQHVSGNASQAVHSLSSPLEFSDENETREALSLSEELEILHWDSRQSLGRTITPSARLVKTATKTSESVLHLWNRSSPGNATFTQSENVDWAFCTPVVSDSCPGWAIYVAGAFGDWGLSAAGELGPGPELLEDDLKFTELTATTLGALRQVRALQRRQDSLSNFFAPVVLKALDGRDPETVLRPRETDVSVLFCDLRGFSKRSERESDQLLDLLARVSDALGVMTHHILANHGVVGDFHGDAAMGFWGWPISTGSAMQQVCQAALAIRDEFEAAARQPSHALADFRAGLGIASGAAVAGRIGTADQVKVTVFGPVVNLASRLEGMTKQLQAAILVDEKTADWVRQHVQKSTLRIRRVAKVLPYGMHKPLVVSELLPPENEQSLLRDDHLAAYEEALDCFLDGDWGEAFRLLHRVPAEDHVKDFLTVFIAQHRREPPMNWQGVIELPAK